MKSLETFLEWADYEMWVLDWGKDYPHLVYENTSGHLIGIPEKVYAGGTGEPNDPYQIQTLEQLTTIGFYPEDFDKHFILTGDYRIVPSYH